MEITKEYIEDIIGQEITDFKVGVNNDGIVEIKAVPKSSVKRIEVMININKSDGNVN